MDTEMEVVLSGGFQIEYSMEGMVVDLYDNDDLKVPTQYRLTIASKVFDLGGQKCVWLKEKPYPVKCSHLKLSGKEVRGYQWSKPHETQNT